METYIAFLLIAALLGIFAELSGPPNGHAASGFWRLERESSEKAAPRKFVQPSFGVWMRLGELTARVWHRHLHLCKRSIYLCPIVYSIYFDSIHSDAICRLHTIYTQNLSIHTYSIYNIVIY